MQPGKPAEPGRRDCYIGRSLPDTPAAAAAGAANVKPLNGLVAFMRPGAVGGSTTSGLSGPTTLVCGS